MTRSGPCGRYSPGRFLDIIPLSDSIKVIIPLYVIFHALTCP